ncbi:ATP-binding protein [Desulfosediminicola sp.]|uniref:ATP-binding protein n=1 Tax=Desulfosediminicola sp. TaxID=2886825 RepID=UPI003AF1F5DA
MYVTEYCRYEVGIPAEVLLYIYAPYITTRRHGEGKGFGLSIVKGRVIGCVWGGDLVDSQPGKGSCFSLCFPCYQFKVKLLSVSLCWAAWNWYCVVLQK